MDDGRVFILVSDSDARLTPKGFPHVEVFSERPMTPLVGGDDPDNWPPSYTIYEANIDGGDSVVVEWLVIDEGAST